MSSIHHYVHNIDPFAIQFTETFGIRWYGIAYVLGLVASYYIFVAMAKKNRIQMTVEQVGDFVTLGAIGVMAGGRIGYCLFYSPDLLTQFSSDFPFWGVLAVHKGGMASHGGMIGVILACIWFAKKHNFSKMHMIDLTAYTCTIGFTAGRIANFINGELFGRPAPEALSWGVKFPTELYHWSSYQFQELKKIANIVDVVGSIKNSKGVEIVLSPNQWVEWVNRYRVDSVAHDNVNTVIDKLVYGSQYGNQKIIDALQTVLTPRYPSQLIQAFLEGFFIWIILTVIWMKPRKAGVISGVFGIGYSIARIIGEQFRMPDAHLGFQWLGLTRGQWLSVGFLLFAIGYTFVAVKSQNPVLGGLFEGVKKNAKKN